MMLPDWERQRLIDGLSGAELEVWERLGFPLAPAMLARLVHWRQAQARAAKDREAEARARRRTLVAEAEWERENAMKRRARRGVRVKRPNMPKAYKVDHRKAYPAHGAEYRRRAVA